MSRLTACFSMYSLMSSRTSASSLLNRYAASALASSVLPTPVGPRNMKDAMGPLGSARSARERWMASATASTASSWPIMRLCSSSVRCSSLSRSLATSLVTGMPVQREMTLATSASLTSYRLEPPPSPPIRLNSPGEDTGSKRPWPWSCEPRCEPVAEVPGSPADIAAARLAASWPSRSAACDLSSAAASQSPSSSASSASAFSFSISMARRARPTICCPGFLSSAAASPARSSASAARAALSCASTSCRHSAAVRSTAARRPSDAASICRRVMRRSTSSSASGLDVISILSLAAASSTRSIALSGRNLSAM
mmetsp:Transcript_19181/g.48752  ORF Transcript_19181/g.48752 Transcript_19181/m.48752 type:complete len:312 (-) Transcript_19181:1570-2505(-)